MTVHVFGVRHHGPGGARSVRAALEKLEPDIVLVEGPPEGNALLPLVLDEGMSPPVAMLVYRPDMPRRAVFYPFAVFSPEWQAIRYALTRGIPARFCDLPQAIQLATDPEAEELENGGTPKGPENDGTSKGPEDEGAPEEGGTQEDGETLDMPDDPLGMIARGAGYPDFELWWEEEVERRVDPQGMFDAILVAMSALRDEMPPLEGQHARREAHMRQAIRTAERETFDRIAVVCGAWHAPALHHRPPARTDIDLLRNLPRTRVDAVWIPWTYSRLSYRSGYGAGIVSPGWYDHLWTTPRRTTIEWIARAAQLLRHARLDASVSNVIDAVRLSDTLAALRDRHMPGLEETREAIRTSLCNGLDAPLRLIQERLEVGDVMGTVPESAAAVPLQRDVEAQQRRLRLPVSEVSTELDLDLRREVDLARSRMLHRLRLLEVRWGTLQPVRGKTGTFHEVWRLRWDPALTISLIDKAAWGNTLADAAGAFVSAQAGQEADLPALALLLQGALLADLPDASSALLAAVQAQAALSPGVRYLMGALPPLVQIARYGDVRGTSVEQVAPVIDGLLERVLVELPGACLALDDDAAAEMVNGMTGVRESVSLLDRPDLRAEWQVMLRAIALHDQAHPLVRGWCCRSLLEDGVMDGAELQRLATLALSPVTPAGEAASWIDGVVRGSAMVLLHQDGLWAALDGWLRDLDGEIFSATLPLVRRAFSRFGSGERRAMGDKVRTLKHGTATDARPDASEMDLHVDRVRAAMVLPVLARILGVGGETRD